MTGLSRPALWTTKSWPSGSPMPCKTLQPSSRQVRFSPASPAVSRTINRPVEVLEDVESNVLSSCACVFRPGSAIANPGCTPIANNEQINATHKISFILMHRLEPFAFICSPPGLRYYKRKRESPAGPSLQDLVLYKIARTALLSHRGLLGTLCRLGFCPALDRFCFGRKARNRQTHRPIAINCDREFQIAFHGKFELKFAVVIADSTRNA